MGILQRIKRYFSYTFEGEQAYFDRLVASLSESGSMLYAGQLLYVAARKFPHELALITPMHRLSYRELYFRVVLLAKKMQDLGIKPADRVALSFENSAEFYIAYFAAWQIGAVCVPLNIFLHPKEIAYIINDAKPGIIVVSAAQKAVFLQAKELCDNAFPTLLFDDAFNWEDVAPERIDAIDEICPSIVQAEDALCLLLYTSGTTGVPKGVMLSSRNILTNTLQVATRFAAFAHSNENFFRERFFAALPLFHVFAQNTCIWFPMLVGGTVIVVPRIDRKEILAGLAERPTLFFGVPALYGLLCLIKTAPLESVRIFVSGGDAMSDRIRSAFALVYGRKICSGYGLTEASPVIAVNIENQDAESHVVGKPLINIWCQIRDDENRLILDGGVGTLWVRGENVMLGYFGSQDATNMVLDRGWLCTGDLAQIDSNGNVSIIGRSKDLIIHKGFNIYPQEVENVLMSHPAVFRAAVIGREDALSGQVPVAFVALRDRSQDAERRLREFCGEHLAAYKVPRKIICLDDLPINATGKVDKKRLSQDASV